MDFALNEYNDYKDSEIKWLGKIPTHWNFKRVKEIALINNKSLGSGTSRDYEFDYVDISSVTYGIEGYHSESIVYENAPSRAKRIVKKDDIIVSTVRTYLKAIAFIKEDVSDLIVSTGFAVISLKKHFYSKYFSYLFISDYIIDTIVSLSTGVSYPAVNSYVIGDLLCVVPPLPEQKVIADYLDEKTKQIDQKISLLKKKADRYAELKQALINETVTRGLDASVEMKDSGIEWIGEIPVHWEVKRMKDIFQEESKKGYPDEPLLVASQDQGVILKSEYKKRTMTAQKNFHLLKLVEKGNYVISLRSFEGGIEIAHNRGIISSAYTVLSPLYKSGTGFYKNLFKSKKFISLLTTCTTGIREGQNISYTQLRRQFVPFPDSTERKLIADYLDEKTGKIEQIIEKINVQVEKLAELRKTLINDVVTGRIKVV